MKKTFGFLLLFFFGLILITILNERSETEEEKGVVETESLILGYCKTFERYAVSLAEKNDLDLILFGSSFDVLANLKAGNIDYGVIGRRAYGFEINDEILEIPLEEYGWTLVSLEKGFVEYNELKDLNIATYLEEEDVLNFFSFKPNISFHENLEDALKEELVLISWEDFSDELQLVVPMEGEDKVEKFRTPMLYMHKETRELKR